MGTDKRFIHLLNDALNKDGTQKAMALGGALLMASTASPLIGLVVAFVTFPFGIFVSIFSFILSTMLSFALIAFFYFKVGRHEIRRDINESNSKSVQAPTGE